jgi:hypothetical protein
MLRIHGRNQGGKEFRGTRLRAKFVDLSALSRRPIPYHAYGT